MELSERSLSVAYVGHDSRQTNLVGTLVSPGTTTLSVLYLTPFATAPGSADLSTAALMVREEWPRPSLHPEIPGS
jgi:hypothetical protein